MVSDCAEILNMNKLFVIFAGVLILVVSMLGAISGTKDEIFGGCDAGESKYLVKNNKITGKISYCNKGDLNLAKISSKEFVADEKIKFWYAGYPEVDGVNVSLFCENNEVIPVNLPNAGDHWVLHELSTPLSCLNRKVILVAEDNSFQSFGWIGISSPANFVSEVIKSSVVGLLKILFFNLIVYTYLVAIYSFARLCGSKVTSVALTFVSVGLVGYLAFYVYYLDRNFGVLYSFGCLVAVVVLLRHVYTKNLGVLEEAAHYILPVTIYSIFVIFIGYFPVFSIGGDQWMIAANRWGSLPIDNWISKIFADQIWQGYVRRPMIGDWLSSDRGPLLTGIFLIFYPIKSNDGVLYQVVATVFQSVIFLPIFLCMQILKFRNNRVLIFSLALSSLMIVHTLFVWPKLMSAAYLLIAYLFIFVDDLRFESSLFGRSAIVGLTSCLAMLSHGGAIFALISFAIAYVGIFLHRRLQWDDLKFMVGSLVVFIVALFPWIYYGSVIDPSYSRLAKWHFAGYVPPTSTGFLEIVQVAYSKLTMLQWFEGRVQNLKIIFDGNLILDLLSHGDVRGLSFFKFNYSMWFLGITFSLPVWVLARCPIVGREVLKLFIISIMTLMVWILVMFEGGTTVIHQGTFISWISIYLISGYLLTQASRIVFYTALLGNLYVFCRFYFPPIVEGRGELIFYYSISSALILWFFLSLRVYNQGDNLFARIDYE